MKNKYPTTINDVIDFLNEYKDVFGNIEVKFEAFEYGGLVIDTDDSSRTFITSLDGKKYLNIELK